jgi:glycosyltransferase involved in cell wall biosynthesis
VLRGPSTSSLVSILIPAFNAQEWIADTIRSAVAQTWDRKEIIVVDDGSTDNTLAIVRQFEDLGVQVATQKNQGAAATRNNALALSKGDYIQWLDADDLLSPDKISRQLDALQSGGNKKILLSSAWGKFMYRHYRAEFVPTALWCDLSPSEWLLRKMEHNLHMQTATWLVSRELTQAAGPWDTTLLGDDDGEYFCRVLLASDSIKFVPEARVYYRSTPNSLSYIGRSAKKIEAQWRSMELHISYLRLLEESGRVRAACVIYLQNWLDNFYPERPDIVNKAQTLAAALGGELEIPRLSWKYVWIDAALGRTAAKRAKIYLPKMRWSFLRFWDKTLFRLENLGHFAAAARIR